MMELAAAIRATGQKRLQGGCDELIATAEAALRGLAARSVNQGDADDLASGGSVDNRRTALSARRAAS